MIKAILLTLAAVTVPVQAQFAYACAVTEEPASSCCVAEEGGAGMALACDTGSLQGQLPQGQLPQGEFPLVEVPCAELAAQPCVELATSEADQWVRSASSSERDADRHMPPAAAPHPTDPFPAFTPQISLSCVHAPVASLGAGADTYLVTQRLRI